MPFLMKKGVKKENKKNQYYFIKTTLINALQTPPPHSPR